MTDLPPPTRKWPDGVRLLGGPDHGVIAQFGGAYIEPSRVIGADGLIHPSERGRYEYQRLPNGEYIARWCPDAA